MRPHLSMPEFAPGTVWLVGAGPGDPGLLTLHALHALEHADVVLHDALVTLEILALCRPGVLLEAVGKRAGRASAKQLQINQRLITLARQNLRVVRLKGGDPLVFGRGGEEALALVRYGVSFEVVPGITAGQACASGVGIPLTHRGLANGVRFISGHRRNDEQLVINPQTLADPEQTLVIYMGLGNLGLVVDQLLQAGRTPDTPAAIIERGTTPRQRSLFTTVGELPGTAAAQRIESPALLVIGDVVSLAAELGAASPDAGEAALRYA
jgi:uroporphyrin-III C-methyltransferase